MNDIQKLAHALINAKPQMDLVGPTADDDIRRAITRYGEEAVKEATKRHTKAKRGRKPEKDWPELRDAVRADAIEWLSGGDPFSSRSNYSIAKDFADRNPGQSAVSTHKRIERKLVTLPFDRRWMALVNAETISQVGYPHELHLRALKALAELRPEQLVWQSSWERARATIGDYETKTGSPPAKDLSMREIEQVARNAFSPKNVTATGGLLGGLFTLTSNTND